MVTRRTPRISSAKKSATSRKSLIKKRAPKTVSQKVDYYPNRMTVAISLLAGTMIVLLSLIAVLGARYWRV